MSPLARQMVDQAVQSDRLKLRMAQWIRSLGVHDGDGDRGGPYDDDVWSRSATALLQGLECHESWNELIPAVFGISADDWKVRGQAYLKAPYRPPAMARSRSGGWLSDE